MNTLYLKRILKDASEDKNVSESFLNNDDPKGSFIQQLMQTLPSHL